MIFPYRLYLAAMHYNENADRAQALDKHGQRRFAIKFPKYKKGAFSVSPVKEPATFCEQQIPSHLSTTTSYTDITRYISQ